MSCLQIEIIASISQNQNRYASKKHLFCIRFVKYKRASPKLPIFCNNLCLCILLKKAYDLIHNTVCLDAVWDNGCHTDHNGLMDILIRHLHSRYLKFVPYLR